METIIQENQVAIVLNIEMALAQMLIFFAKVLASHGVRIEKFKRFSIWKRVGQGITEGN